MIDLHDIDGTLRYWAEHVLRREDGGLGYASQSIYRQIEPGKEAAVGADVSRMFAGVPLGVMDADDVRKLDLVEHLIMRVLDGGSRSALLAFYLQPGTVDQKAKSLGTTRRTMYRWVDLAKANLKSKLLAAARGVRQEGFAFHVADMPQEAANTE
ncbi:hypothetical protein CFN79_19025 [Chromobacterium vaccinii]|uniref:hypothetical protein n=1 Tax=Chromobacterium vaccinii TaxID=1108595 RepID=UPI000CE98431|nr:hypothetical protein [Chromobacterium vaccinii]AVG17791.1 hypothetical protein CFN79_19025 [Chromobacterium vaccinii]